MTRHSTYITATRTVLVLQNTGCFSDSDAFLTIKQFAPHLGVTKKPLVQKQALHLYSSPIPDEESEKNTLYIKL